MIQAYGIPNCDTVKKALNWLKTNGVEVEFHNFKKEPPTSQQLEHWCKQLTWEALLNKKGTTWRKLTPEEQSAVVDMPTAIRLMANNPSVIKRPLLQQGEKILALGFAEELYQTVFKS